jgi:hypothetical protein
MVLIVPPLKKHWKNSRGSVPLFRSPALLWIISAFQFCRGQEPSLLWKKLQRTKVPSINHKLYGRHRECGSTKRHQGLPNLAIYGLDWFLKYLTLVGSSILCKTRLKSCTNWIGLPTPSIVTFKIMNSARNANINKKPVLCRLIIEISQNTSFGLLV